MMKYKTVTHWNEYFPRIAEEQRDLYFTEEYVKLYEDDRRIAECFIYEEDDKLFLWPYLKSRIPGLTDEYYDFETAYGLGGPLVNHAERGFLENAFKRFCTVAREGNIIAGFIRFHPLLQNHLYVSEPCKVFMDRKTVSLNLSLTQEEIWRNQIHAKHRNVIRKAQSYGLRFEFDRAFTCLDAFQELYNHTMDSVQAEAFYYFTPSYYERMRSTLRGNCGIGTVWLGKEIIAAAIFLYYGIFAHYHLSGSLQKYQHYYPNNYLIYEAALSFKEQGSKIFYLGGGSNNREDNSLYRFKQRFSLENCNFYIGSLILNQDVYDRVCAIWEESHPQKREQYQRLVLKYRF
jgi:serine/alanine adding enzyme